MSQTDCALVVHLHIKGSRQTSNLALEPEWSNPFRYKEFVFKIVCLGFNCNKCDINYEMGAQNQHRQTYHEQSIQTARNKIENSVVDITCAMSIRHI